MVARNELVADEKERFRIIAYLKENNYVFFVRINYIEILTGSSITTIQLRDENARNRHTEELHTREKSATSDGKKGCVQVLPEVFDEELGSAANGTFD